MADLSFIKEKLPLKPPKQAVKEQEQGIFRI
jgi:hypothetical protein